MIDVGFLAQLHAGAIQSLPAVERMTDEGVILADGRQERFDTVIAATGYSTALADLGLDAGDGHHGLHLVGFRESIRGGLYEIRRESLRVAQAIARELTARSA